MRPELTILLLLACLLLVVGPVTRWFGRNVQALVLLLTGSPAAALYGYHALLLPGTLLHEISHLVTAWLLRVRTGRLSLRPRLQAGNMAQLGSVEVGPSDPVREGLIGLAPLVTGLAVLFLIARWRLDLWAANGAWLDLTGAWARLASARDPALWLYLVLAIGNAMLPSASDRRAWWKLGLGLAAVLAALFALGVLQRVPPQALAVALRGVEMMALALLLLLSVDLAVGSFVWLLGNTLGRLLRRQLASR